MQTLKVKRNLYTGLSVWASTNADISWNVLIWTRQGSAHYILSGQRQHCLHPLSTAIIHIRSMMKQFLRSVSVWQHTSHPQRARHDISVCVWASVSGANPVGTWRCQAPPDPHQHPHPHPYHHQHPPPPNVQLIANVTKQPAFCPLKAHMNIMFSFLRNSIITVS